MTTLKEGIFGQKARLAIASERFKEKIKLNIGGSISKIERTIITGLIITGSLVLAYKFAKALITEREKTPMPRKKPNNNVAVVVDEEEEAFADGSGFLKSILETIALFILIIAREKLEEFIQGEDQ